MLKQYKYGNWEIRLGRFEITYYAQGRSEFKLFRQPWGFGVAIFKFVLSCNT